MTKESSPYLECMKLRRVLETAMGTLAMKRDQKGHSVTSGAFQIFLLKRHRGRINKLQAKTKQQMGMRLKSLASSAESLEDRNKTLRRTSTCVSVNKHLVLSKCCQEGNSTAVGHCPEFLRM